MACAPSWDNPDTWVPPLNTPADIAGGKTSWKSAAVTDLGFDDARHDIHTKCSSCDFVDGGDLANFNYSSKSDHFRVGRNKPSILLMTPQGDESVTFLLK